MGVPTETMLFRLIHRGDRPPLSALPDDTPPAIVDMVRACWSSDRAARKSSAECAAILDHCHHVVASRDFDIFFSHAWATKPFLSHVYVMLTQLGFRVWYDQHEMGHDLQRSMREGIARSKVLLACINSIYQSRPNCMFELQEAKSMTPAKVIVALSTEAEPLTWASTKLVDLCDLQRNMFVDIGAVAKEWDGVGDSGPSTEMIKKLRLALEPLVKVLSTVGCAPALLTCSL